MNQTFGKSSKAASSVALVAALVALSTLSACQRRSSSSAGWASEVPADAVRFVEQSVKPPAAPAEAPALAQAKPPEGAADPSAPAPAFVSKIKEPTEVTLWHSYRATELSALKASVDAFHALGTPIKVVLRAVPFDAFNDKIRVVVPQGRGPDLFIFAHDTIGAWAEMDLIEPLSNWTTTEDRAAFLPETVKALVYRNALYGLPIAFKSVALFYNKALITAPPKTVEELISLAKQHTAGDRYGLVYEATNLYFHAPWLFAYGAEVLDGNDNPVLNSEGAIKAIELARSLVKVHGITPMSVNTGMVSGYFNEGRAAMVINGPWMRGELAGVDYGVAPLPSVEGKAAKPFLGVEAVYLNKQSPRKEAAMEVARYLTSDASAAIRYEVGKQPVANRSTWEKPPGGGDPVMDAFREQAKVAVVMPSSPAMQAIWTPYNGALLSVIAGDTKPSDAIAEAQRDAVRSLAESRGAP
jgi:arabinogalactan oligomer/maltooligosaccharide transport system substrate-binding protein